MNFQSSNPEARHARDAAVDIVQRLRHAGHVAYLAGGCVRDQLLGLEPKDYDIATDATPDLVHSLFPRSQGVGEAFGVVLVHHKANRNEPRITTEVATFRSDGPYDDGRRPTQVRFTDARHDAQRRDFTINALFLDPLHNETADPDPDADRDGVIDFVGGRGDLAARVLRAVGDAERRFGEDYLRMLRAVRFAARLGFELAADTATAIRASAQHLGQISRERIGLEIRAMLAHPNRAAAAALLQRLGLDGPTLNEASLDAPLPTLGELSPDAMFSTALAAWLIDRHGQTVLEADPQAIKRWRNALALSNDERDALTRIFRQAEAAARWDALDTAARKRLAASEGFDQAMLLRRAMDSGHADDIASDIDRLAADGIGLAPPPLLTGQSLVALGLTPGPRFRRLLDDAYDRQLTGELQNTADAEAWAMRQFNT